MGDTRAGSAGQLLAAVRDLSFCRTVADVMAIVQREARALTAADGVTFVLREGDQCHYAEENAIAPLWKGRRFPMGVCVSGWVMLHGQTIAIEDIYADARVPADAYRPTFVQSLAMAPVRSEDPLGAIGAYWATRHRATDHELQVLQALADAAALALENVRLYGDLQAALSRAEALNRAKDEWISVLSHELRTPLTPVLGWTRMLRTSDLDTDRQKRALEVIERNVIREIGIVDNLLDVSRAMTGTLRIRPRSADLRTIVNDAAALIRPVADAKPLTLTVTLPASPLHVEADSERLGQAVHHLLANAVKFTPPGGRVAVRMTADNGQAAVAVEDSGIGIAPDVLPRVFACFARADSSPTRGDGGMGIGLFMVGRIVELHGGSVSAHSDGHGRGCVFVLHLPIAAGEKTAGTGEAASAAVSDLRGARVLVVDDDADTLDFIRESLQQCGATVQSAGSVAEALSACHAGGPFDLVVSDLAMPEEDGFDLLARIRALPSPLHAVPMVALTAHASETDGRRALECGFERYLSKPIDPTALAVAIGATVRASGQLTGWRS